MKALMTNVNRPRVMISSGRDRRMMIGRIQGVHDAEDQRYDQQRGPVVLRRMRTGGTEMDAGDDPCGDQQSHRIDD
jgi:hypothetical protein